MNVDASADALTFPPAAAGCWRVALFGQLNKYLVAGHDAYLQLGPLLMHFTHSGVLCLTIAIWLKKGIFGLHLHFGAI